MTQEGFQAEEQVVPTPEVEVEASQEAIDAIAGKSEPEPELTVEEYRAQLSELRSEKDALEQRVNTVNGRVRSERERDAAMAEVRLGISAITDHLSNPDADPLSLRDRLETINAARAFDEYNRDLVKNIHARLDSLGLSDQDPVLKGIANEWGETLNRDGRSDKDIYQHFSQANSRIDAMSVDQLKDQVKAAEQRGLESANERLKAGGARNMGTGKGVGSVPVDTSGMTADQMIQRGLSEQREGQASRVYQ